MAQHLAAPDEEGADCSLSVGVTPGQVELVSTFVDLPSRVAGSSYDQLVSSFTMLRGEQVGVVVELVARFRYFWGTISHPLPPLLDSVTRLDGPFRGDTRVSYVFQSFLERLDEVEGADQGVHVDRDLN